MDDAVRMSKKVMQCWNVKEGDRQEDRRRVEVAIECSKFMTYNI
jgi:hypothetical protein